MPNICLTYQYVGQKNDRDLRRTSPIPRIVRTIVLFGSRGTSECVVAVDGVVAVVFVVVVDVFRVTVNQQVPAKKKKKSMTLSRSTKMHLPCCFGGIVLGVVVPR